MLRYFLNYSRLFHFLTYNRLLVGSANLLLIIAQQYSIYIFLGTCLYLIVYLAEILIETVIRRIRHIDPITTGPMVIKGTQLIATFPRWFQWFFYSIIPVELICGFYVAFTLKTHFNAPWIGWYLLVYSIIFEVMGIYHFAQKRSYEQIIKGENG